MSFQTYFASAGSGSRYEIMASASRCGEDWSLTVCGGTAHHVGSVAAAWFAGGELNIRCITLPGHRDDTAARIFAENMARSLHSNVSVSAGIHIDSASRDEITKLLDNCRVCCERLLDEIRNA